MAFVVEDGSGLEDSNSYASVEDFKLYWDDRGYDYTEFAPDALIEEALVRATDYIETNYGLSFKGIQLTSAQALSWPRSYVYDRRGCLIEGIPVKLKQATFQYAKRALTADLQPDPEVDSTGQLVLEKEEEVGPLKERTKYSESGLVFITKPFPAADTLLQEFTNSSNGRTIRA